MNPLAVDLNKIIEATSPATYALLSAKGKRLFFPTKGIVGQSAMAKAKADVRYNATVGIGVKDGAAIGFPSLRKYFDASLSNDEVFNYSNSFGNAALRKAWKERLRELNPLLKDKLFSLPLVSSGLTHALYMTAELFFDAGDSIVLPDQIWGNYRLMFNTLGAAKINSYPFFDGSQFNLTGFKSALQKESEKQQTVRTILNFPNNPTGYSPTEAEATAIIEILVNIANQGTRVLVLLDEAYFGLFLESNVYSHSLFSQLADAHENIVAVKICGATKEFFAWGFRVGFLTFATKPGTDAFYNALEHKAAGNLRGSISNCSTSAQNILLRALSTKEYQADFALNYKLFQSRFEEVKRVLAEYDYSDMFTPYPFNSGYFMLVKLASHLNAETIRTYLLDHYKIGVISTSPSDLRIAFSSLEQEHIEHVFTSLYQACKTHS
ncbi:hypothetical protein COTS27_00697 [Spirochaetota bacterium]|nr:hypothetical protein COTS27_00697 [Spirochaetota bacterium]